MGEYHYATSYDVFLRTQYLPHIKKTATQEPYPVICLVGNDTDGSNNLWDDKEARGWSKEMIVPKEIPVSGHKYTAGDVFGTLCNEDFRAYYKSSDILAKMTLVYIPPGWKVVTDSFNSEHTTPKIGWLTMNGGIPSNGHITFIRTNLNSTGTATWDENHVSICMSHPYHIAGVQPEWLMPHQEHGCDPFMEDYCSTHTKDEACNCIVEKASLLKKYPNALPQVTCLGINCGIYGYRTEQMMYESCNIEFCASFIDSVGEDNVIYGDTEIYCAGKTWSLDSNGEAVVTIIPPSPHKEKVDDRTPQWYVYVIAVFSLIIAGILIYIIIDTYGD